MPAKTTTPQTYITQDAVEYDETETCGVFIGLPEDGAKDTLSIQYFLRNAGATVGDGRIDYDKSKIDALAAAHPTEFQAAYDAVKQLSYIIQMDEGVIPSDATIE